MGISGEEQGSGPALPHWQGPRDRRIVVGCDLSSYHFHCSLLEFPGGAYIDTVVLTAVDKKADIEDRLWNLSRQFGQLLRDLTAAANYPDKVVIGIEEMSHPRNARTNRILIRACSYAYLRAKDAGIAVHFIHNMSWKAAVYRMAFGSDRQTEKGAVKDALMTRYGAFPEQTPQDTFDSIGVGLGLIELLCKPPVQPVSTKRTARHVSRSRAGSAVTPDSLIAGPSPRSVTPSASPKRAPVSSAGSSLADGSPTPIGSKRKGKVPG